ncbi:uncharacterized protein PGTG_18624 [Puccinia graminis f. sp. tritici CRL 75-36-700-3]|uniref:Uncharacterized protein n=1 Tax=Puccinia graminis f. sp. tritici (strain CRL 75-36-700-3 / race SCCL) TaxID=418459 RepID=E3L7V0_PUCGT|nr:uncharacterized protein PGTG_18624 [Puccinia graminis f. sp. tritici CRL 75-36-700-3]EFP92625.2 hypothetical protein PGTG_18624 [Puccinia graminis f. sp. tritici CRL 75-36-700-3]
MNCFKSPNTKSEAQYQQHIRVKPILYFPLSTWKIRVTTPARIAATSSCHKKDPILAEFTNLSKKYGLSSNDGRGTYDPNSLDRGFSALSIDEIEPQENLLNKVVHRYCLPQLKEQVQTLSSALAPSEFAKQPEMMRQVILQTQAAIDRMLHRTQGVLGDICLPPTALMSSLTERMDDGEFRSVKAYRLDLLKPKFNEEVLYHLNQLFTRGHTLFQHIQLAPNNLRPQELDACSPRHKFLQDVDRVTRGIEATIRILECSELELAQEQWVFELPKIDEMTHEIMGIIHRHQTRQINTEPAARNPVDPPAIQLAKLSLPLIKIVKLFFTKISVNRGMNRKLLPTLSKMSSGHIHCIAHSPGKIHGDIIQLLLLLQPAAAENRFNAATCQQYIKLINQIKADIDTPSLHVVQYCLPLLTNTPEFQARAYYIRWFETWDTLFDLAVRNCKRRAKKLDPSRPVNN